MDGFPHTRFLRRIFNRTALLVGALCLAAAVRGDPQLLASVGVGGAGALGIALATASAVDGVSGPSPAVLSARYGDGNGNGIGGEDEREGPVPVSYDDEVLRRTTTKMSTSSCAAQCSSHACLSDQNPCYCYPFVIFEFKTHST